MQNVCMQMGVVGVFIVADFVTGIVKAVKGKQFSSENMREGLYHKCAELFAMLFTFYIQFALPKVGFTIDFPISAMIVTYISIMEIGSIIENIGIINPQLVGPLSEIFEKIGGKKDD